MRRESLQALYDAGAVLRLHTSRTLWQQDLAGHSWGVALIVAWLYDPGGFASAALLTAALLHDLAELKSGDVPAPAKWGSPQLAASLEAMERAFNAQHELRWPLEALTAEERAVLSYADAAELLLKTQAEAKLGNTTLREIERNALAAMKRQASTLTELRSLTATRATWLTRNYNNPQEQT